MSKFAIVEGGGHERGKGRGGWTYHRDDFILDDGGQGNELEVEGEVGLYEHRIVSDMLFGLWQASWRRGAWSRRHTELTRSAIEMVCCARVMVSLSCRIRNWGRERHVSASEKEAENKKRLLRSDAKLEIWGR